MEAHPTLEYQTNKGDKTYVDAPWAAFSSGAVEAHPTLEYQKIKGDKTDVELPTLVVEAPGKLPRLPGPDIDVQFCMAAVWFGQWNICSDTTIECNSRL